MVDSNLGGHGRMVLVLNVFSGALESPPWMDSTGVGTLGLVFGLYGVPA